MTVLLDISLVIIAIAVGYELGGVLGAAGALLMAGVLIGFSHGVFVGGGETA